MNALALTHAVPRQRPHQSMFLATAAGAAAVSATVTPDNARASNGQRYPLPCHTHFGNLKYTEQGKGYC